VACNLLQEKYFSIVHGKKNMAKFSSKSNGDNNNLRYLCPTSEINSNDSRSFRIVDVTGTELEIAVFNISGKFYAISNRCKHEGGPLSEGILKEMIVTCPWHGWKYSITDGKSPHKGGDSVDSYEITVFRGRLYVNSIPRSVGKRVSIPHSSYLRLKNSVTRYLEQMDKDVRPSINFSRKKNVLGISTTNMNEKIAPRKSTSEQALKHALDYAKNKFGANTDMIKLRNLAFKHCEGYYSKNAKACVFPCSISEMDKDDQMIQVYEKLIVWADVLILATPVRWGNASSLYYQMIQRLNCVQNQIITHETYLIRDKVASFIITGGQDNVQHVAGELMTFWSQLGFIFGKFPFVGWSRGWYAEDTENNLHNMNTNVRMKQDIDTMVRGAVELSTLVSQSHYDELVLNSETTN
jgi:multimeric flavodoxin WrbA/nitrite reductase/ring-hydroxylating ferredoxin subunit